MHNNGKVNIGTVFRPIYPIGGLLAHAKIDVPSEMLFGRYRKLRPEMSALLNSGRVLAHPVRVGRCCMGVLHVNTYIYIHAHTHTRRSNVGRVSSLPFSFLSPRHRLQLVQDLRKEGTIFGCQVPPISFMRPAWLSKVVKGLLIRRNDFSQRILFAANIIPAKSYLPPTLFLRF